MKFLVLGAGAIGGYFGGRLAEAGTDVTFLVRAKRREQLDREGLCVESKLGDFRIAVKTVLASDVRPVYDIVLLTCKAYDFESAVDAIVPAMRRPCAVLPLMNGISHFACLDEKFGKEHVMGGTCQIYVTLDDRGVIRHAGTLQRFIFGERDRSMSSRAQALADALGKTKIDWELSNNIQQNLWEKIVFLSALAATTCLFRANVGEIITVPGARETMERLLTTTVQIASREGYPPRAEAIEFARRGLTDPTSTRSASMLRDMEAGGLIESDHVIGWMLDKARAHGVDDTILSLAYTHVKAYEARRMAGRLPGQ